MIARTSRLILPLLLSGTILSACAHGDYGSTASPVAPPQAWKQADAASAANAWPAADWWGGFGSAELVSLLADARRANPDLAASAARLLQADARARAAGADLLPSVNGSAGISRQESDASGPGGRSGRTGTNVGLSASYELDFWGANKASADSAAISASISRLDQETVALTVTSTVANTYFQVLSLRDRIRSAEENLELAERVMKVVDARYRNGAATALEVAQQRTSLTSQRASLPALRQQELAAANSLAVLLGRSPGDLPVVATGLGGLGLPATGVGVPSDLLERRPDLKAAARQLEAAGADIVIAKAALYPAASISLSGTLSGAGLSSLVNAPSAVANAGLSLAQSIFDGGRRSASVDAAQARRVELVESYRKAILTGFSDVETALAAARNAERQRQYQEETVRLSRELFRLAETRYREGATDLLTLLDAQRSLLSAQDQLTQVRLAEMQAAVSLYRALGGGWTAT
ncbi:efflux transporter outer membrane subunit [Niveispirillum sp. KHB5.9]|uniref:efflux transporter outer membrane subunit n=1 Tax=Niveispirillum sp. KHB5.9 TaxID=3400269 RepID=UPI003A8C3739